MQSPQINHSKCPKLHELVLCSNNHSRCQLINYWENKLKRSGLTNHRFFCNGCISILLPNDATMTCGKCKFDLCSFCSNESNCPKSHHLKLCRNNNQRLLCIQNEKQMFFCNGCISILLPNDATMTCGNCVFDLCMKCYT